jgi:putative transcriptional regulator
MRNTIKKAISESVQDLIGSGLGTSFTERELHELGVKIPDVRIDPRRIKFIRSKTRVSQSVFAKLLNVGLSGFAKRYKWLSSLTII